MGELNEWLKLAPSPAELAPGSKWHVFLSYRSTDRAWVLALYDTLTQLGYSVFMDQFVLQSGAPLATALEENLEASQAGVLVLSSRYHDSPWCKHEYESFQTLKADRGFPFVIARLDEAPLPLFARKAIWEGFIGQQDGPHGMAMLRLLHGLHGLPAPTEAVRLAVQIDEQTHSSLALLRAHTAAGNAQAVTTLAASGDLAWRTAPLLACAAAEALIAMRAYEPALSLLERTREAFPRSLRSRQLQGFALARAGRSVEAHALLGQLYELGERDPETIGIYARTWMDLFDSSGDQMFLQRSCDLYAEGFALAPDSFYLGVNAAAKSIFLNDLENGKKFALQTEAILDKVPPEKRDHWHVATAGEVQLMQRKFTEAARIYRRYVAMTPGRTGDHRSTAKQARRLLKHLKPSREEGSQVLAAFRRVVHVDDPATAVDTIRNTGQKIVTFCGFSGTGYEDEVALDLVLREQLARFTPQATTICAGGTAEGIGRVYGLALRKGFNTLGIVSSQAGSEGVAMSDDVETVYIVQDDTWGGQQGLRLSPTSEAMVEACDEMIGIGGGAIARDELLEARKRGKMVRFFAADMNHARAAEKARNAGQPGPTDFRGEAHVLLDSV